MGTRVPTQNSGLFQAFSAHMSNFMTFQVPINNNSKFATFQDPWKPCQTHNPLIVCPTSYYESYSMAVDQVCTTWKLQHSPNLLWHCTDEILSKLLQLITF